MASIFDIPDYQIQKYRYFSTANHHFTDFLQESEGLFLNPINC